MTRIRYVGMQWLFSSTALNSKIMAAVLLNGGTARWRVLMMSSSSLHGNCGFWIIKEIGPAAVTKRLSE